MFNNADAAGIAALHQEEDVNHKLANSPVVGRKAIQEMFEAEFKAAKMGCIPEKILEKEE